MTGPKRIAIAAAIFLLAVSASAVTTKDMATGGVTPEQIVSALAGAGVTISNVKITGAPAAIGSFTGGTADGLAVDSGVIMSSGEIGTAAGPNTSEGTSGSMGTPGDTDLDALVTPNKTHDAIILEFDVVTAGPAFSIRYVFASEEYKEYVGSVYNDVFAFFVDGQNIALVPGGTDPVAVNTINHQIRSGYYNDNPAGSNAYGTSFDGFTSELVAVASVTPGESHHIKLAIADASDSILDSAVFLAQGGISGQAVAVVVPEIHELLTSNGEVNDVEVAVYGIPDGVTPDMSADGLPEDSSIVLTPKKTDGAPNFALYNMKVNVGPDTQPGVYSIAIRAGLGEDLEAFGTVLAIIDCSSPMILGTPGHQPANASVSSGDTAKLTVVPNGTSVFKYQWYNGHSGITTFPIAGATSATLTTPAITGPREFWVRVSNPCGSVDSATATVTTK